MRKTTYSHYDLGNYNKKLQTLKVDKFLGVDFNPAQLQVANNHAVDMENILFKNRVNQKRSGWEQIALVEPYHYHVVNEDGIIEERINTTSFNGFWQFEDVDGGTHYIAHIGKLLYKVTRIGKGVTFLDFHLEPLVETKVVGTTTYHLAIELEDYKSFAQVGYGRLFIFGGNKLFVLKVYNGQYTLKEVEDDEDTYIPVTTIGITEADSAVNEQQILDDVNMMSQWRRNKLVSGTYVDDGVSLRTTRFTDYQLDTSIKPKKPTDINNIEITISSLKEIAKESE